MNLDFCLLHSIKLFYAIMSLYHYQITHLSTLVLYISDHNVSQQGYSSYACQQTAHPTSFPH